jgi:hypothetical protein
LLRTNQQFSEVRVFEGVAERTGTTVDRSTVRGSQAVCRSIADLTRKVRQRGDGYFYVPVDAWPEDATQIPLFEEWTPMS